MLESTTIVDPYSLAVHYNDRVRLAGRNAASDEVNWRLEEIKNNLNIPLQLTVCSVPKAPTTG